MGNPDLNTIRAELDQIIVMLLRVIRDEVDRVELWRIKIALQTMQAVRSEIDRPDIEAEKIYWHVAGNIRSIFFGWADSSPEFKTPEDVHKLMYTLYKRCLPFAGHK